MREMGSAGGHRPPRGDRRSSRSDSMMLANDLVADCDAPGCGRRGVCLPALDFANGHERMTRDEAVPESMDRVGIALHTESYQAFFPYHGSVESAVKKLRRVHEKPWRLLCARCLALKFVRQKFTRWTGHIFGADLTAKLRGLRRRKDPAAGVDRLLDKLERDLLGKCAGMRASP